MIVSKLNPIPFQSVNSPLLDPVNSLRPSGVHCAFHQHSEFLIRGLTLTHFNDIYRVFNLVEGGVYVLRRQTCRGVVRVCGGG